jgi:hypothetical protein
LTTLASWTALAADDNPYHDPGLCVRGGQTVTIDGKSYAKININLHLEQEDPRKCSLRTAHPMYPILVSGKPLSQQEWLRSVYAANQGTHPTVLRRCVPAKAAPADATEEELSFCPRGLVNYFDVPSNGWIAWVLIPRQPVSSWGEKQTAAAKSACSEATSDEAKKNCQAAGYGQSEKTQPLTIKAPEFQDELNAKLDKIAKSLTQGSLSLALSQNTMIGEHNRKVAYVWLAVSVLLTLVLIVVSLVAVFMIRSLKKQLKEARRQKTIPTGATLVLQNRRLQDELEKAKETIQQLSSVDYGLELQLLQQQHNAELLEVNHGWQTKFDEAAAAYNRRQETSSSELAERDKVIAAQEGQIAAWKYRHKTAIHEGEERIGQEASRADELEHKLALLETGHLTLSHGELETRHSAAIAEKDAQISQLRDQVDKLEEQLRAANDNAHAAVTPPSTETKTPPSTETSNSSSGTQKFPFEEPLDEPIKTRVITWVSKKLAYWIEILRLKATNLERVKQTESTIAQIQSSDNRATLERELDKLRKEVALDELVLKGVEEELAHVGADALTLRNPKVAPHDAYVSDCEVRARVLGELINLMNAERTSMQQSFEAYEALAKREVEEIQGQLEETHGKLVHLQLLYQLSEITRERALAELKQAVGSSYGGDGEGGSSPASNPGESGPPAPDSDDGSEPVGASATSSPDDDIPDGTVPPRTLRLGLEGPTLEITGGPGSSPDNERTDPGQSLVRESADPNWKPPATVGAAPSPYTRTLTPPDRMGQG